MEVLLLNAVLNNILLLYINSMCTLLDCVVWLIHIDKYAGFVTGWSRVRIPWRTLESLRNSYKHGIYTVPLGRLSLSILPRVGQTEEQLCVTATTDTFPRLWRPALTRLISYRLQLNSDVILAQATELAASAGMLVSG